ncbi:NUDIX domain-containing protein [Nonomuraea sp. NPDC049152]|uniref:NUDIX domain-containing protein n=1 Tax=Nonomuraea sp. NPDC049152 TaxID=3154350 RepID=UPI0033E645C0
MSTSGLRRSVRAILVDEDERVLLCRHDLTSEGGPVVWAMPGGGVEPGESLLTALRRELDEEVGLLLSDEPHHV